MENFSDESIDDLPCASVSEEHTASTIRADEAGSKFL
jgi:hypothetical protein